MTSVEGAIRLAIFRGKIMLNEPPEFIPMVLWKAAHFMIIVACQSIQDSCVRSLGDSVLEYLKHIRFAEWNKAAAVA